ncbi:MAG: phosphatase PAP2 family protein [Rikenellaceae bacterium]|nr:phosphatase PAP2 family protein [Rikenellaceae bacterium]
MKSENNIVELSEYEARYDRYISTLAKTVSFIFHPFLLPIYGIMILMFGNTFLSLIYLKIKINLLILATICTLILPGLSIFLLYRLKVIKNLSLKSRSDRVIPLLVVAIGYMLCSYYLSDNMVLHVLTQLVWAALISILACLIVNFFWKISLHMTAMGGMVAFIIYINMHNYGHTPGIIYLSILSAGALATSRLYLGKHKIWQILAGFLLGYIITLVTLLH